MVIRSLGKKWTNNNYRVVDEENITIFRKYLRILNPIVIITHNEEF